MRWSDVEGRGASPQSRAGLRARAVLALSPRGHLAVTRHVLRGSGWVGGGEGGRRRPLWLPLVFAEEICDKSYSGSRLLEPQMPRCRPPPC